MQKEDLLKETIKHINIKEFDSTPIINSYENMAFQSRNLARAAKIYDMMLKDRDCAIILTLAGSLISAGLKNAVVDLIENNMVDAIVSTGANIVDQDFFEALGYKHYVGSQFADDNSLREMGIDRIYDTYIDEDELRICDDTIGIIADSIEKKAYSSREFIIEMGKFLVNENKGKGSIVRSAYEKKVPIFCPAFSDCSAGFGLVYHQVHNKKEHVSIDSVKDFRELTEIKIATKESGLLMLGGGVPKNFVQDVVVSADILGKKVSMHKYAVQLTVADERDGALSGSTLKEASSWGKVDTSFEQMVFSELTITFPLLASYAYHQKNWQGRQGREFNSLF
jgi:deoxyhypusine synthase